MVYTVVGHFQFLETVISLPEHLIPVTLLERHIRDGFRVGSWEAYDVL